MSTWWSCNSFFQLLYSLTQITICAEQRRLLHSVEVKRKLLAFALNRASGTAWAVAVCSASVKAHKPSGGLNMSAASSPDVRLSSKINAAFANVMVNGSGCCAQRFTRWTAPLHTEGKEGPELTEAAEARVHTRAHTRTHRRSPANTRRVAQREALRGDEEHQAASAPSPGSPVQQAELWQPLATSRTLSRADATRTLRGTTFCWHRARQLAGLFVCDFCLVPKIRDLSVAAALIKSEWHQQGR